MAESFDCVVIGSGPGGYYAAIRCAQKGATVAIVEKSEFGGTCLNRGCIPSKALLGSAHALLNTKQASVMGIDTISVSPNWTKIQERKDSIVAGFRKGLTSVVQSNKIKIFGGRGIAVSANKVSIESNKGSVELEATKGVIIATGSEPIEIGAFPFDGQTVLSSTEALSLCQIPKSMVVVGGGVIGCELACVYSAVGTKVTIVEALERILNTEDKWVSQLMTREFKKLGIDVLVGKRVTAVEKTGSKTKVLLESSEAIEAEKVLVSVGRRPVCDKEMIDGLGLKMNGQAIAVNEKMQTNLPGVYAIGDVVGKTFLAHGAFAEAEVAADNITGGDARMEDYSLIPRAIYTFPEVASVGKTEDVCVQEGIDIDVGRAFFRANGRSLAHNETVGEIRVVREKGTEKILGIAMVGAVVTELIAAARFLIGSNEKFEEVSFAHPTVSEVLKEAWEDAFGLGVHILPKVNR